MRTKTRFVVSDVACGPVSHVSRCPRQVVERYPKTTPQQLMFYMNAWCTAYYALYFFGVTGAWLACRRRIAALRLSRVTTQAPGLRQLPSA